MFQETCHRTEESTLDPISRHITSIGVFISDVWNVPCLDLPGSGTRRRIATNMASHLRDANVFFPGLPL
jgi:hypothetical protein